MKQYGKNLKNTGQGEKIKMQKKAFSIINNIWNPTLHTHVLHMNPLWDGMKAHLVNLQKEAQNTGKWRCTKGRERGWYIQSKACGDCKSNGEIFLGMGSWNSNVMLLLLAFMPEANYISQRLTHQYTAHFICSKYMWCWHPSTEMLCLCALEPGWNFESASVNRGPWQCHNMTSEAGS